MRGGKVKDLVAAAVAASASTSTSTSTSTPAKVLKKKLLSVLPADAAAEKKASVEAVASLKKLFQLPPTAASDPEGSGKQGGNKSRKVSRNGEASSAKQGGKAAKGSSKKRNSKRQSDKSSIAVAEKTTPTQQHDDTAAGITKEICQILEGNNETSRVASPQESNNDMVTEDILSISWFSNTSPTISQRRKAIRNERKARFITKNRQTRHFDQLVRICAEKLGTESTFEVLSKLGRETGIQECKSLISLYIKEARKSSNEEDSLVEIKRVIMLLKYMCEQGFELDQETYGPFLMYLIDKEMTQEFQVLSEIIRKENPKSASRIGYYRMLLYIRVGDEAKIQDLCNSIEVCDGEDNYLLAESYLLALCASDRKKQILHFLEMMDIRKISSVENIAHIFKSLGRLLLENVAEDLILTLRSTETGEKSISSFIFDYVSCLPNLVAEELLSKFSFLHKKLGVVPSTAAYDKFIALCCSNSSKVHAVVDVIDQMCQTGLSPSSGNFHSVFAAIEQSGEIDLVRPIYTVMCQHKFVPKDDTVRGLIYSFTRMGDFVGAYSLLDYLNEMNKKPTTSMYNSILAGHFRENDVHGVSLVLKQMKDSSVERDAETYSYLIVNCKCKEDIVKYHDEMKQSKVKATRQVSMALITAYANCGMFDEAKQVILDEEVPIKYLNDIKSVLVAALASNGKVSEALVLYDEIRQAGFSIQNKAILCLIEYVRSEGELERLLQLLEELNDSKHWFDASGRIVLYCLRFDLVNEAVELLKQMKEKDEVGACSVLDQAYSQLWEREPTNVKTGLELLRAIKEDLHLSPSRTSLDFLLSACVKARDSVSARYIWAEYGMSDLPFNALTFLRMYQVLLATEEFKAAKYLLKKIPRDDPHVRTVINACQTTFSIPPVLNRKEKPPVVS